MGAGANEIEIGNAAVAVMRTEPGTLSQDRFDGKRRSLMCTQLVAEIKRREHPMRYQLFAKPGHIVLLKVIKDALAQAGAFHFPVKVSGAQMRHGGEYVVAAAAGRRQ